jgi:alpha-tubulin suppressor-like RCC1 family protein
MLGNGTFTSSLVPVQVAGLTRGASAVSAGTEGACAVVAGGVVCWGRNENDQLDNGTTASSPVPVQVTGLTSGVTAVSVGRGPLTFTSCALTASGNVFCWGSSNAGALGAGPGV